MATPNDRLEKTTVLRAPRDVVWRAISDSKQFGAWFGVDFDGPFAAGEDLTGRLVPTQVEAEGTKEQHSYIGMPLTFSVVRIEPMRLFSFRWHPFAIDTRVDYSKEATTLVVFELEDATGGTQLRITESGFDGIPLERRAKAFASNVEGWADQLKLIEKYLAR